jgi:hypothetical protein
MRLRVPLASLSLEPARALEAYSELSPAFSLHLPLHLKLERVCSVTAQLPSNLRLVLYSEAALHQLAACLAMRHSLPLDLCLLPALQLCSASLPLVSLVCLPTRETFSESLQKPTKMRITVREVETKVLLGLTTSLQAMLSKDRVRPALQSKLHLPPTQRHLR